jgi:hypothetical protein
MREVFHAHPESPPVPDQRRVRRRRLYPVATKRVLRAILKAADFCVSDPKRVARLLVDRGYTKR